jgi:hypothetical protein
MTLSPPESALVLPAVLSCYNPFMDQDEPKLSDEEIASRRDAALLKAPKSGSHGTSAPPDDIATRIMAQMVRMPPKPHEKMKVGKGRAPEIDGK